MKVLLLLTLIGCSLAFAPGTEYKYNYEGRLGLGIPEIRNKFSGVGIKAVITLQFQDAEHTFIKFSDVQVGEYVGDAGVRVTNLLPIQFSALSGSAKSLEEPFQVFFKKNDNQVMVVPQSDPEWIVNLRKSIAQLFLIEPIRGNFGFSEMINNGDFSMNAFSLNEPTFFGICSVDYAVRPFDFSMMEETKMNVKDNKFTVQDDEDTFLLTRTINFDKCREDVRLMLTHLPKLDGITKNLFGNVASRSSVMTVKFVGKPGNYKIQEGNVQGYFAVNPFGVPSDKLMSITNQTYYLESVSQIRNHFVVPTPTRFVNTWFMEVASPYSAPQNPTTFINYYNKKNAKDIAMTPANYFTGIPFNPSYVKKFMTTFDKLISETSTLMFSVGDVPKGKINPLNTNEGKITSFLETLTQLVYAIDVQGLEELFEKYYNDKSEIGQMKLRLFIDVCVANGISAPMKVLVNQMEKQRITPERITSIFSTFANSFMAIPILPDILRFVKTVNFDAHPFMATNVYINFATVLKKLCITTETSPSQIFGREECDLRIITEDFIPFLKQKFDATRESYERATFVQSLANLGTPEAMKFIASIATGDFDFKVRQVAIYGLGFSDANKMIKKDDIFNMLMPIVHNAREDALLRQAAIVTLLSWRPSPSWWYRLAASTWNEPSESVGSLIYYLIKGNYYSRDTMYSEEIRIAHFLLPLTKRFPETDSFSFMYNRQNPEEYTNAYFNFAALRDDTSSFPRNFYNMIIPTFGEVRVPFLETIFSTNMIEDSSASLMEEISKIIPQQLQKVIKTASNKRAEEIFTEIKKLLKPTVMTEDNSHRESVFITKLFSNLQFTAPINAKTLPFPFNTNTFEFLKSLASGKNLQLSKFFNPAPTRVFFPTELGLPFYATVSAPTVQSAEGNMKFNFRVNSFDIDFTTNYKFASKFITEFTTFVPWNENVISSGVETMKSLNIPAQFKFSLENVDNLVNVSFAFVPTYEKEFVGMYTHNIPYVAIKSMYPGQLFPEYEKFEILSVNGMDQGIHRNRVTIDKDYTGIDSAIFYEGDVPYPFTYGNFYENFRYPYKMVSKFLSPTTKLSSSAFVFNFGSSETKAIFPSFAFNMPFFFNDNDSDKENDNQAFIVRLLTTGTANRFFESNFQTKVLSRDANVKRTEIYYRSAKQFPGTKPQVFCMQMETRQPTYYDFNTLLNQLNSRNMDYSFMGKVRGGASCDDAQFATIKGSFQVSNDKKIALEDEITKELKINKQSEIDNEDRFVYDRTSILVEYKEPLPSFFTNMTYNTYDVIRGSQFPHSYHNYYNVKNQKGRINVEGERFVDGAWNLRVELPTENVNLDYFQIPMVYSFPYMFFGDMNLRTFEFMVKDF